MNVEITCGRTKKCDGGATTLEILENGVRFTCDRCGDECFKPEFNEDNQIQGRKLKKWE